MSNLKYIFFVLVLLIGGCYHTSVNETETHLRPRVLEGSLSQINKIVYSAAVKAFPEATEKIKVENEFKITILREWFWRGDTLITITIEQLEEDKYQINVDSKPSWHRLNGSVVGVNKEEVDYYLTILDQVTSP